MTGDVAILNPRLAKALKGTAIGAGVLVLAVGGLSVVRPDIVSFQFGPIVTNCFEDDEIPDADRKDLEREATGFVRKVLGNDVDGAYAEFSSASKAVTSKQQLQSGMRAILADGPFGPVAVTRSYLVDLRWGRGFGQTMMCDSDKDAGGGDLPKLGVEPRQANIVVVTSNPKGRQSFTVWLNPDGGSWRVRGFHYQPVTRTGARP